MKIDSDKDTDIIDRIVKSRQTGDYAILVNRYKARLFAFVGSIVSDQEEAEELAQDCFVRAFQRLEQYDERQGAFYTWLQRIAYRLCIDYVRRRPEAWLEIDDEVLKNIPDEYADRVMDIKDDRRIAWLIEGIRHLPPTERLLVQQHYFDGQLLKEIAQVMDIDSRTLATRLHRIRRKLYYYIKAQEYNETNKYGK